MIQPLQLNSIVGGLQGSSSAESANSWLLDVLSKAGVEGALDIYDKCKGGEFNGMFFVKFGSPGKRDEAIKAFGAVRSTVPDSQSYMNKDRLVQQRAKFSFLLNLKKLLQGWSIENVRFDENTDVLSKGGDRWLRAQAELVGRYMEAMDGAHRGPEIQGTY